MADEQEWVEIACPECHHVIVAAPRGNVPQGELLCPGCGAKVRAPGPLGIWIAEIRERATAMVGRIGGSHDREQ